MAAHADPAPAIGGAIANGQCASALGWAYYFTELTLWIPGGPRRRSTMLPGAGTSVKRAAWERYGPFLEGDYCSDAAFYMRLRQAGEVLLLVPDLEDHEQETAVFSILRVIVSRKKHCARDLRHDGPRSPGHSDEPVSPGPRALSRSSIAVISTIRRAKNACKSI